MHNQLLFQTHFRTLLSTFGLFCFLSTNSAFCQEGNGSRKEPPSKLLIIHADDAGMSHSVNRATIEGLEKGTVTSASIMVPCPWFPEFAKYCKEHPKGDYGIHLTLNSEWTYYRWGPVADPSNVPSLVDKDGYLWDNVSQVAAHAKASEARIELKAQIDRAIEFGIPLSHLDTHMGAVFSRPDLLKVYIDLGVEYNLPVLFVKVSEALAQEYPALAKDGERHQKVLESKNLPVLDRVAQFYGGTPDERGEQYSNLVRTLEPGVTLLIIHCGFADDELKAITTSAARRDQDRRIFTDPDMKALLKAHDVQLATWRELAAIRN